MSTIILKNIVTFVKLLMKESVTLMMKRVLSISLSVVMLFALLHISVATHYCGGKIAATSISLSGKLASCGMEDKNPGLPLTSTEISRHCCDNVLKYFGINGNYFPTFSCVPEAFQNDFQVMHLCAESPACSAKIIKSFYANVSPPGVSLPNSVELSKICTFLI
jgi:hypothetical protein